MTTATLTALRDQQTLDDLVNALAARNEPMARALQRTGFPALRHRPAGFPGLVAIFAAQQLSVAAAAAILRKLETDLGGLDAERFAAADEDTLRALGLSRAKAANLKALAASVVSGAVDLSALPADPEEASAALVRLPGVGRWTAEIYLLFCLGHPDVWPAGDLALQVAAQDLLGLPERPSEKALRALGEPWAPARGVAAHLLWSYYHVLKGGRSGAPV